MSWSLSVPPTPREEFNAAVDAAVATGQPADLIADDVAAVKEQLKRIGSRQTSPKLSGSGGGHVANGTTWGESMSLQVNTLYEPNPNTSI